LHNQKTLHLRGALPVFYVCINKLSVAKQARLSSGVKVIEAECGSAFNLTSSWFKFPKKFQIIGLKIS
jgi:hypothetical protein